MFIAAGCFFQPHNVANTVLQVEEMVVFLHRTEPDLEFEGLLKRRHTQIKYLSVLDKIASLLR